MLAYPASWDDAFLKNRPFVATPVFWACLPGFLMALLFTFGMAWRLRDHALLVPALVILGLFVIYQGSLFLNFVETSRKLLAEGKQEMLEITRSYTRLFMFAMYAIGICMVVLQMSVRVR